MRTREIPRAEWTKFFDNMSRRQEGWEVGLEVFSPDIGDQIEGRHMFLAGMTAEVTKRGDKIEIMMAGTPNNHHTCCFSPNQGRSSADGPGHRFIINDQIG